MRKLIYHVAISLDGFIAQENDKIDLFPTEGDHIPDYIQSLTKYDTCIMGRRTYEFGYQYGLQPGENPYPHMTTYVYSRSLSFAKKDSNLHLVNDNMVQHVTHLKEGDGKPIYLCGGGVFATELLQHGLINELHLKHCPIIIGHGIPLFTKPVDDITLQKTYIKEYSNGVNLIEYSIFKAKS